MCHCWESKSVSTASYPITNESFLDHLKREIQTYFSRGAVGASAFTISIHLSPSNPDFQMIRDQYCGRIPLSTEDLFKRLYAPMLLDKLHACTFQIEMCPHQAEAVTDGWIVIAPKRQSVGQFEMVVYANGVEEDNVVEVLVLPDKSTIVVGHFDPLRMNPIDVQLAFGAAVEKYPTLANGQRLSSIVSRTAFVLFPQPTGSWLCQVRKQGEYMWVQDPDRTQVYFPLSFPNRTVRFTLNEFLVLVQDFECPDNRIYCQIRERQTEVER